MKKQGSTTGKFEVRSSKIVPGEKGLFSREKINSGEFMYSDWWKGKPFLNSGHFEVDYDESFECSKMNHSRNPNTKTIYDPKQERIYRIANRNILPGEEITGDYSEIIKIAIDNNLGDFPFDWLWFEKKGSKQVENTKKLM